MATARMADMDPELEPFLLLFPPADLTDPVTARKNLAELGYRGAGTRSTRRPRGLPTAPARW